MADMDESQQHQIVHEVLDKLRHFELDSTAPEMAFEIHRIVRRKTGIFDPYHQVKTASTQYALTLYPWLKALVAEANDPLETAIRLSIAGNIIDMGVSQVYDLEKTIERVLAQPFAIEDFTLFRETLSKAESVLYLADNAGETVFDRILIEMLKKPVTYVVKHGPIINDATEQDALAAGLDEVSTVVTNGSSAPGTILHLCSEEFNHLFKQAKIIIAKGQANYECLSATSAPVFFLLQTKCQLIAQHLDVPVKSIVFKAAVT
jgi:uncharacterized protein with ATP-grasp and redox domains